MKDYSFSQGEVKNIACLLNERAFIKLSMMTGSHSKAADLGSVSKTLQFSLDFQVSGPDPVEAALFPVLNCNGAKKKHWSHWDMWDTFYSFKKRFLSLIPFIHQFTNVIE